MTIFLDVSKRKTPEGPVHPFRATRRDRPARQPEAPGAARAVLCGPASVGRSPREPCFLPGGWCPGTQTWVLGGPSADRARKGRHTHGASGGPRWTSVAPQGARAAPALRGLTGSEEPGSALPPCFVSSGATRLPPPRPPHPAWAQAPFLGGCPTRSPRWVSLPTHAPCRCPLFRTFLVACEAGWASVVVGQRRQCPRAQSR